MDAFQGGYLALFPFLVRFFKASSMYDMAFSTYLSRTVFWSGFISIFDTVCSIEIDEDCCFSS